MESNAGFVVLEPSQASVSSPQSVGPIKGLQARVRRIWNLFVNQFGAYLVSLTVAALLCMATHHFLLESQVTPKLRISAEVSLGLVFILVCAAWARAVAYLGQLVLGVVLTGLFIQNTIEEHGNFSIIIFLVTGCCLAGYFVAEAFEISVTQLRAKESDRIPASDALLLQEIEANHHVFYEAREWFVIALVICLTLASDFNDLHIGHFASYPRGLVTVGFSLLFTTVLVVWTAQSPGKNLALDDPIALLRFCRFLWKPLLIVGTIMEAAQLFRPAEPIMELIGALPGLRGGPRLKPSQEAYYNTSLKRYGYSLHNLQDEIRINRDGSGRFRQTGLFYVVCGRKTQFMRWFSFLQNMQPNAAGDPDITVATRTFFVPNFDERLQNSLVWDLDAIFKSGPLPSSTQAVEVDFGLGHRTSWERNEDGSANRKRVNVSFESPIALPEGFRDNQRAVAIYFVIEMAIGPDNYSMPALGSGERTSSYNYRTLEFPCRTYSTLVHLEGSGDLEFGPVRGQAFLGKTLQSTEDERVEVGRGYPDPTSYMNVKYPMPGIEYKLSWEIWPNPRPQA